MNEHFSMGVRSPQEDRSGNRKEPLQSFARRDKRSREGAEVVPVFVTLENVAKLLGYKSVKSVRRKIDVGELPGSTVIGGRLCLVKAELDRYIADRLTRRNQYVEQFRKRRGGRLPIHTGEYQ